MSDILAADPSAPPEVAARVKPVSWQDAWNICNEERERAILSGDIYGREIGNAEIAAYHDRRAATFALLQTLLDRVGTNAVIKDELRMMAEADRERAAQLAALDNPDKQEAAP